MQIEEIYMQRCLQLASMARGSVAPNPMVGSVVVCNGVIIGEGYHTACGCSHAEVEAIASVKDKMLLSNSTLYVNLEPCSHYGKTPPCAKLIIGYKIPRVIIGTLDPFPKVSGKGVEMLQEAGVEVFVGVLEEQCRDLNKIFFCFLEKKRPYIVLKWAQTKDGFIDKNREDGEEAQPTPISNGQTRMQVHKLRSELQSILVGTNTAIKDNPSLTVRFWSGRNPLRLVVDRLRSIPVDYKLLNGSNSTVVYTSKQSELRDNLIFQKIDFSQNIIPQVLNDLYKRQIQSLLVEGGCQLLQSFIDQDIWDEVQVEVSDLCFGAGVGAPKFNCVERNTERIGKSEMYYYKKIALPKE